MANPNFSMVTVQCEDSGIMWETSSSRCSTPWASEASTTSDVFSMESSSVGSPPGKVIFIMDENKLRRKKVFKSSDRTLFPSQLKGGLGHKKHEPAESKMIESASAPGKVNPHTASSRKPISAEPLSAPMLIQDINQNVSGVEQNKVHAPVEAKPAVTETTPQKVKQHPKGSVKSRIQKFNAVPEPPQVPPRKLSRTSANAIGSASASKGELPKVNEQPIDKNKKSPFETQPEQLITQKENCVDSHVLQPLQTNIETRLSNGVHTVHPEKEEKENIVPNSHEEFSTLSGKSYSVSDETHGFTPPVSEQPQCISPFLTDEVKRLGSQRYLSEGHAKPISPGPADEAERPNAPPSVYPVPAARRSKTKASLREEPISPCHDEELAQESPAQLPKENLFLTGQSSPFSFVPITQKHELQSERESVMTNQLSNAITPKLIQDTNGNHIFQSMSGFPLSKPGSDIESSGQPEVLHEALHSSAAGSPRVNPTRGISRQGALIIPEEPKNEQESGRQSNVFSIVSEGYEILNILAPPLISSVDQEESEHMQDKLEYLEKNPLFKSKQLTARNPGDGNVTGLADANIDADRGDAGRSVHFREQDENAGTAVKGMLNEGEKSYTGFNPSKNVADMDYFEKYTLVDDQVPIPPEIQRSLRADEVDDFLNGNPSIRSEGNTFGGNVNVNSFEDEFYSPGTDIDEVFYGSAQEENNMHSQPRRLLNPLSAQNSIDRDIKREMKTDGYDSDSTCPQLFSTEERVLSRSMLFPTSVQLVNPELLEEPPALAFLYTDLYEQATGDRTKEDSEHSDTESAISEQSFPGQNSDPDDGPGIYFEKYILKDEIPYDVRGSKKSLKDHYESDDFQKFEDFYVERRGFPETISKDVEFISSRQVEQIPIQVEAPVMIEHVSEVDIFEEKRELLIDNCTQFIEPSEMISCELSQSNDPILFEASEVTQSSDPRECLSLEVGQSHDAAQCLDYEVAQPSDLGEPVSSEVAQSHDTRELIDSEEGQAHDAIELVATEEGQAQDARELVATEEGQTQDARELFASEECQAQDNRERVLSEADWVPEAREPDVLEGAQSRYARELVACKEAQAHGDSELMASETGQSYEAEQLESLEVDQSLDARDLLDSELAQLYDAGDLLTSEVSWTPDQRDLLAWDVKPVAPCTEDLDTSGSISTTAETLEMTLISKNELTAENNNQDDSHVPNQETTVFQTADSTEDEAHATTVQEDIHTDDKEETEAATAHREDEVVCEIKLEEPSADENNCDQFTEETQEADTKSVSQISNAQQEGSNGESDKLLLVIEEQLDESISLGLVSQPQENEDNKVIQNHCVEKEDETSVGEGSENLRDLPFSDVSVSIQIHSYTQEELLEADDTDHIGTIETGKTGTTEITAAPQMSHNAIEMISDIPNSERQSHNICDELHSQSFLPILDTLEGQPEIECQIHDEETAESMDYEVITHEELLQDEMSSEFAHEELLLLEDKEFSDHASDGGYEFVSDLAQDMTAEHEESSFEMIEHEKLPADSESKRPESENEPLQKEPKTPQIDTYCYVCRCPIAAIDKIFGEHASHEVTTLDNAVIEMTNHLEEVLEKLQESSIKTEEFVTEIETLYNAVEENYDRNGKLLEEQNEEMVKMVEAQHKQKMQSFEEVKKMKMEYLYDQMVSFQQNIDTAKEILEKTVKETEELEQLVFLNSGKEINTRLLAAMENTLSLEKMPSAFSLFEHYAENSLRSEQKTLKHIPVPHTPKLRPQEANSATGTSITAYWGVSEEDVIDCFQVYCMEEPQGNRDQSGLIEEYRVTVKESYCLLEELEPDKCYNVWVMAVNYTGCSLPSEKATFRTAPSTPLLKAEDCTVCWDTAIIRWSTAYPDAKESFTLECCRQYSPEGEGLRSIAGIKGYELTINLQPNENYFFYVRAVNNFGSSEQSEAALISTKGTRFHLLKDTAHPPLQVSPDGGAVSMTPESDISGIPSILGEPLPARGLHYWEITVANCTAFRIGVCYTSTPPESILDENDTSWCMYCCSTGTSFNYKFLHNGAVNDVLLTEHPVRIGVLLDYNNGRLVFFNVEKKQLLFTIRHRFTNSSHPAFALEAPGEMHLHTGVEMPAFTKLS
ncbi:cardiomyopathy-associated protein 5 isoform X2 [Ambystoma mexicanum]